MKKTLLMIVLAASSLVAVNAQELGLRFGSFSGKGGAAVDGIFSTGDFSRIHADLSFGKGIGADVLWDFLYRPLGDEVFKWYVGAGPYTYIPFDGSDFALGVVGEIGIAYYFSGVPLSLSADYRPSFEIISNTSLHWGGFGLNVRWVFGGN